MSDTFDHEGDAWASYGHYEGGSCEYHEIYGNGRRRGRSSGRSKTSNYTPYMPCAPQSTSTKHAFTRIEHETAKAYLFRTSVTEGFWVPKALCSKLKKDKGTVLIWDRFEKKPIKLKALQPPNEDTKPCNDQTTPYYP